MSKIKIYCEGCKTEHDTERTSEIPEDVTSLVCNWCPICEDKATEEYMEGYRYLEVDEIKDENQLKLL